MKIDLPELKILERLLSNRINAGFDPDIDKLLHKIRSEIYINQDQANVRSEEKRNL